MESDFESNTSVVAPPLYEFPYEIHAPVHILPLGKSPKLLEEPYFRPDYGIQNVILDGKWKIYPTLYSEDSCSTSTPSSSQTTVRIDDNSLLHCKKQTEKSPLVSTLLLCVSCKKRFTSETRHNYLVIILLIFIALLSTLCLFPWGVVGLVSVLAIPKFLSQPICKKCRKKCC